MKSKIIKIENTDSLSDLKIKLDILTKEKREVTDQLQSINDDIRRIVKLLNLENVSISQKMTKKNPDYIVQLDTNKFYYRGDIFMRRERDEIICVTTKGERVIYGFRLALYGVGDIAV
jgi:hypothetical protein